MKAPKVYLDVSCLNRPFDDQRQRRIRTEAQAVYAVLVAVDRGEFTHVASEMTLIEIDAMPSKKRKRAVKAMLPPKRLIAKLTDSTVERARELERLGFKAGDALHIAAAEAIHSDVLLTCDDRFCCAARRNAGNIHVRISNPCDWLKELEDDN